jgi:serum/glucocorticoid-regulated kinase 2
MDGLEMIVGIPPFYDENVPTMYQMILQSPLLFPKFVSESAQDILKGLLCRNPDKRLGSQHGSKEIKSHPFFASIDWEHLYDKKLTPPFKPSVENALDTSNFDDEFTSEIPYDSVVPDSQLSQTSQGQFEGFTFIPGNDMASSFT